MLKIFLRAAREKRKKYKENPLLGVEGGKVLNRIALYWGLSGFALGYALNSVGVLASSCDICWDFARVIPSIYSFSTGSSDPNTMFYVMIYYLITSPIVFLLLVKKVVIKYPEYVLSNKKNFLVWFSFCLLGFYMAFMLDFELGGLDAAGIYDRLHRDFLLASISFSFAVVGAFVLCLFYVYVFSSVLLNRRDISSD